MRAITILLAALAMTACEDDKPVKLGTISYGSTLVPSAAIEALISPQTIPFFPLSTVPCFGVGAFSTAFDLIIIPANRDGFFIDHVTFQLIDGSNLGTAITIPRPQLNTMFGSTLVTSRRSFGFQPQFGCGLRRPLSIVGDLRLLDQRGATRNIRVSAPFLRRP